MTWKELNITDCQTLSQARQGQGSFSVCHGNYSWQIANEKCLI